MNLKRKIGMTYKGKEITKKLKTSKNTKKCNKKVS